MTDIVERLRDWMKIDQTTSPASRMAEAANTIESLRQRVKDLEEELAALKEQQDEWEKAVLGQHSITYNTSAPSIPEGWQLVPIEPTPEMITAGTPETEGHYSLPFSLWKAMLLAAPKP